MAIDQTGNGNHQGVLQTLKHLVVAILLPEYLYKLVNFLIKISHNDSSLSFQARTA